MPSIRFRRSNAVGSGDFSGVVNGSGVTDRGMLEIIAVYRSPTMRRVPQNVGWKLLGHAVGLGRNRKRCTDPRREVTSLRKVIMCCNSVPEAANSPEYSGEIFGTAVSLVKFFGPPDIPVGVVAKTVKLGAIIPISCSASKFSRSL